MYNAKKTRLFILEFLLIAVTTANITASTISNYRTYSLVLKGVLVLINICVLMFILHCSNIKIRQFLSSKRIKSLLLILFTLILIPSVSLIYSKNVYFGFLKVISLALSTIPVIVIVCLILLSINELRIKAFYYTAFFFITFSSLFVVIFNPFASYPYQTISIFSWSHVIYGRLIGFMFLFTIIYFLRSNKKLIPVILLPLITVAMLITNLRASILGAGILSIIMVLYYFIRQKTSLKKILGLLLIIVISTIVYYGLFLSQTQKSRLSSLGDVILSESQSDGGIAARETAYKYSWEYFLANPLTGAGFGGFYSDEVGREVKEIKYPHNIFLEMTAELGIIGLVLISIIVYLILRNTLRISFELFIMFCFGLLLAMFSKDLPSQTMFLIGLAFYGADSEDIKM